jgi:hypothetical protein
VNSDPNVIGENSWGRADGSIKTDHLRTARILAVCIAVALGFHAEGAQTAPEAVDLELVLAADGSGSIDDYEFRLQRAGYAAAMTSARVLDAIATGYHGAIAVAYVEWGGASSQHTLVDWTVVRDQASARVFADALQAAPRMAVGYNSISGAIDHAARLIATDDHDAPRKIIDVSGDGPQIGGRPVEAARAEAVISGITINALVIKSPGGGYPGPGGMPLDLHYRRDVIGGSGAFVMVADDRQSFPEAIVRKLILEIAGTSPAETAGTMLRAVDGAVLEQPTAADPDDFIE